MRTVRIGLLVLIAAGALSPLVGCASVDPEAAFADVRRRVADASGLEATWRRDEEADRQVGEAVDALLAEPLTADGAVGVALLVSPVIAAQYERLGIAEADLVEAGLLPNPTLGGHVRWPDGSGATNVELELMVSVFDLLLRPQRVRLAESEARIVRLDVAAAVLDEAAEVRAAYYTLAASERKLAMRRAIAEAAGASAELSRRMHEAGNASELDLALRRAELERAELDVLRQQSEARGDRIALHRLMGLGADRDGWKLADDLPMPGAIAASLDELLTTARVRRLDRRAAVDEVAALAEATGFQRDWGWLGEVRAGASTERGGDRTWIAGPAFELELPIFDQGQAKTARLGSQWRAARRRLEATDGRIRADVAAAFDRVELARAVADRYRTTVIPLRQRIVTLAQQKYNFMLVGVFDALEARADEYEAYEQYLDAVRDFWSAHAELQRAVGVNVAVKPAAPDGPTPPLKPGAPQKPE